MTEINSLEILREVVTESKDFPKKKIDPDVKRELDEGWLIPALMLADEATWKRWEYWVNVALSGELNSEPIPKISFSSGNPKVRKMLEKCLNAIPNHGSWLQWGSWDYVNYFFDWILYAFGPPADNIMWGDTLKQDGFQRVPYYGKPKEPQGCEGASDRLYQLFCVESLLAFPHDYFGDLLCESYHGRQNGFFPTPLNVSVMMAEISFSGEGDSRRRSVCDPCIGTGRMLLGASNHSLCLYGMDVDTTVLKATLINGWLYVPWLVRPLPFIEEQDEVDCIESGGMI